MARIAIPSIEEAPTKSQPILQNYVKVLGVVPNFFALISQSPDALKAIADMHATLGKTLGKTFGLPLRDAAGEMCCRLSEGHALPGGRKRASARGTGEHHLARSVRRKL